MGLDNATVKEFANLINPFDKTSGEATVYGRVVGFNEIGGRPIVQLDGSSQRIPIRTTVKVKGPKGSQGDPDYYEGDRVLVRIKNHEALIVSNISTQMTTAEGAEDAAKQYVSDNGFIYAEKISGEQGDFYTLSADKFSATQITGALGHFITVNADRIITDAINAQIANIDTIKASDVVAGEGDFAYLNVNNVLDAKMANLDIANINRAKVNSLFVEGFAIASDATIVNGHITGYLDSVEVNANKITAGTLLVDRLYIKDQNNKWKMQTVDGQGQTVYVEAADRINKRTITADKLVAHSITTDELNATNITANNSSFMESLTNSLTTNYLFATQANVQDLVAHSVDAELAELDILNINEELKTQNIHLGEIVFDQPSKPDVMSGNPDYLLGIERETKTISAYDSTALYSEGDYVTHYYSDNNLILFPFSDGTKTMGGITYTSNIDGSMTINGTATSIISQYIYATVWLPNGEYDVRSNSNGSVPLTARYNRRDPSTGKITEMVAATDSDGNGAILKITNGDNIDTEGVTVTIITQILRDTTINNVTMYPLVSKHSANEEPEWHPFIKGVYKCITAITTAESWDEKKWFFLRDAINSDQYEFDHVRYANKISELTVSNNLHVGTVSIDQPIDKGEPFVYGSSSDPYFKTSLNNLTAYNNKGNGKVTISRVGRSSDNPTDSNYEMNVHFSGVEDSTITPGLGGFYFGVNNYPYGIRIPEPENGCVLRFTIIAKIPINYSLAFATNSLGTDFSSEWLTGDTTGTGEWKTYIYQVRFGSGTTSSTGFFYLKRDWSPSSPDVESTGDWRVAFAECEQIEDWISSPTSYLNIMYPRGSLFFTDPFITSLSRGKGIPPTIKTYDPNPNLMFGGIWILRMGHSGGGQVPLSMHPQVPTDASYMSSEKYRGSNSRSISAHSVSASITNAATTLNYNQSGLRSHNHRTYHHCAGGNCSDNLASGDTYASCFNWNPTNWSFCPDTGNWNAASSHSHGNSISVSVGAHSNINVEQETYNVKVWCRIM